MTPLYPGTCYHIYNHANGDDNLFREVENYRFFLQQYERYIPPVADTYAYCLMPNHFHLLVRIKEAEMLLPAFPKFQTLEMLEGSNFISKQFSNLFSSYTQAFNKMHGRRGSLFMKNFKRKEIHVDKYFGNAIAYVHLNAIKHGFIKEVGDWQWTSYHHYLHQQPYQLLNRQPVLEWFGGVECLKSFHDDYKTGLANMVR